MPLFGTHRGTHKHKKKHGVGHQVADEVGDSLEGGCCLGDLLGCSTITLAGLALVGVGVFAGATRLKG